VNWDLFSSSTEQKNYTNLQYYCSTMFSISHCALFLCLCSCCVFFGFPFVTVIYAGADWLFVLVWWVIHSHRRRATPLGALFPTLFHFHFHAHFHLTFAATLEFCTLPCCLVWEFVYLIMPSLCALLLSGVLGTRQAY